jgi:hypothetical protein
LELSVIKAAPIVAVLVALSVAGCAGSKGGSAANPTPTTITTVTQRIVTPSSNININTIDVNSGYTQLIVGSMDAAWTALNVTYSDLKIPITTLIDKQHLIGNETFKVRRRIGRLPMQQILDCGNAQGIPNAETYDIMMSISSTLTTNPKGGLNLVTRIDATGKSPNFSRESSVTCHSAGALEKEIADIVRKKIGG